MSDNIASLIRSTRIARGIRQDDLATEVGISKSYLCHLEAGRRPITPGMAELLAEELGLDLENATTFRIQVEHDGITQAVEIQASTTFEACHVAAGIPASEWTTTGAQP